MNWLRKHIKLIALILIIPFLVQSCTIYKSANVSLDEAVKAKTKVRIFKTSGKKSVFSRVVLDNDGNYYGKKFAESNKTSNKILIDENSIKKVQLKNRTATTLINIFSPIIILAILAASIADDIGPGWENR